MAYFTIANKAIDISKLSARKRRKILGMFPGRDSIDSISAYLIGQLGRCDSCPPEKLPGSVILSECYSAISNAAKVVGGRMIILECRECMFSNFYEKHGFQKFSEELSKDGLYTLYIKVDFREYWRR